jgi:hypothetical protein
MPIRLYTASRWTLARLGLVASAATACGQDNATIPIRALGVTGETSAICLARDADGAFTLGRDRADCPDYQTPRGAPGERHLHLLVTQPISGEVALVDLGGSLDEAIVDFEPTQPGYSFMPVGANPGAIVSTPGGVASFVGVSETGREGIFGLPSSCVSPRPESSPLRDIRTWPACRLPAAPGPMLVLDDPALDDDQDPSTPDRVRARCDSDYVDREELLGTALAANREQCAADLALERPASGRRKLVVTLPSLAEVWVLDAQELLDRTPGSFDACVPEAMATLGVESLDVEQRLPPDLVPSSASCAPVGLNHGPPAESYRPWPEDVALDDEGVLYVADSQAPVIHVLDASNPCALSTLPSLHPMSYTDPNAVVTTRRLDVSSLTSAGQRFLYAIDNSSTRTAGSLMAFDVSPSSTERTPIVRARSPFNPNEPPDRITLPRDVADIQFVTQDTPQSDGLGIYVEGIACDPNPNRVAPESIPALYRPRADLSAGARPTLLRGTYAIAALHSGQVAVIDIEDLDGACRRPIEVNHDAVEDEFGCSNDDPTVPPVPPSSTTTGGYQLLGVQTVTNELSCNIVAPHRTRSLGFFTNSVGTAKSAGLRAFPTLTLDSGRSVATDQSDEGRDQPKMLGARYIADETAELYVGPLRYTTNSEGSRLELDPQLADRSSLLLSYEEPRNFVPAEDFTATYEGVVRAPSRAIFRAPTTEEGYGVVDEGLNASFCNAGVQDMDLTADVGRGLSVTARSALETFVRGSADYVQLTASLLEEDDPYWDSAEGASCGAELFENTGDNPAALLGRPLCDSQFGPPELPVPLPARDLRIVAANEDQLLVEPRDFNPNRNSQERRRQLMRFVSCCFPGPSEFQIRAGRQWVMRGAASGVAHHVTTDPTSRRCVNDCSPLVQKLAGRAFEISCTDNCSAAGQPPPVGLADPTQDFACVVDDTSGGIDPGEPGSECVFQSLTSRLAIYRGQAPSRRDMRFRWQLSDGFSPFTFSLTSTERQRSSPRSLSLVPELGQLVVTDGSAPGLSFVAISSSNLTSTALY